MIAPPLDEKGDEYEELDEDYDDDQEDYTPPSQPQPSSARLFPSFSPATSSTPSTSSARLFPSPVTSSPSLAPVIVVVVNGVGSKSEQNVHRKKSKKARYLNKKAHARLERIEEMLKKLCDHEDGESYDDGYHDGYDDGHTSAFDAGCDTVEPQECQRLPEGLDAQDDVKRTSTGTTDIASSAKISTMPTTAPSTATSTATGVVLSKSWFDYNVGDKCVAKWNPDGDSYRLLEQGGWRDAVILKLPEEEQEPKNRFVVASITEPRVYWHVPIGENFLRPRQ